MRILIAGPPRAGNRWLKCLLAEIYGLNILEKVPNSLDGIQQKIQDGWYAEDAIFHQHLEPTSELMDLAGSVNARFVTILRNPYDSFVSLYFFVQNFQEQFGREHHLYIIRGKRLDHPDILAFLRDEELGYRVYLELANDWLKCKKSKIIRYEKLRNNPFWELSKLALRIKWVQPGNITRAVDHCSMNKMLKRGVQNPEHIRKGKVGDHHNYLTDAHYRIFREYHSDLIRALGYRVI